MKAKESSISTGAIAFRHSMQAKLLIIMMAITILPLLGLQVYSTLTTLKETKDQIAQRFTQISEDETRYITEWSNELMLKVKTLASFEAIQTFDADIATPQLFAYRDLWGYFESFALIDARGTTTINTDKKTIDVKDRAYFAEGMKGNDFVADPAVSRGTGNIIIVNETP
ncbi:MAG: hypothetical protein Q7U02_07715, partial [Desulfosalsimonadaceae bacterium]|nr:hypothetical protein [Desulfosalsimonadaceae bacterium]